MSTISPDSTLGYAPDGSPALLGEAEPTFGGLTKTTWVRIGIIAVLFAAIFWPNLRRLWGKTNPISGDANWGHSVVVPLVGLYYLYVNREQLLNAPRRARRLREGRRLNAQTLAAIFAATWALPAGLAFAAGLFDAGITDKLLIVITGLFVNVLLAFVLKSSHVGFLILVQGLGVALWGIHPGKNDFIWDFGMVVSLFGVVLMLCGWDVMKIAWFPIAFLVCALPWPGLFYSKVALPLQMLAAKVAVKALQFADVTAGNDGSKIILATKDGTPRVLNVAEACAGMRSLMTFVSLGAAIAFLSNRPLWQKVIIAGSAVPIAIFCNIMRVTGQGYIDYLGYHDFATGFAHAFFGMVMLIPAFFMILLVAWVLDHLFIEEADDPAERAAAKERADALLRAKQAKANAKAAAAPAAPAVAATAAGPVGVPAGGAPDRPRQEKVIAIPRQATDAGPKVIRIPPRQSAGARPTPVRRPPAGNQADGFGQAPPAPSGESA